MQTRRLRLTPPRFIAQVTVPLLIAFAFCACKAADAATPNHDKSSATPAPAAQGKTGFPLARQGVNLKFDTGLGRTAAQRPAAVVADEECDEVGDMLSQATPPAKPETISTVASAQPPKEEKAEGTAPIAYATETSAKPAVSASQTDPSQIVQTWEIFPADKTLNAALARWAKSAGWQLLWELPIDYAVEARTSVPGTFEEAVGAVAKTIDSTEVPVKAIFYAGNKVLRIVAKGAE